MDDHEQTQPTEHQTETTLTPYAAGMIERYSGEYGLGENPDQVMIEQMARDLFRKGSTRADAMGIMLGRGVSSKDIQDDPQLNAVYIESDDDKAWALLSERIRLEEKTAEEAKLSGSGTLTDARN